MGGRGLQRERVTEDGAAPFYPHDLIGQRTESRPDPSCRNAWMPSAAHQSRGPCAGAIGDAICDHGTSRFLSRDPLGSSPCEPPILQGRRGAKTPSASPDGLCTEQNSPPQPRHSEICRDTPSKTICMWRLRDLQRPFVGTLHVIPIAMISPGAHRRKCFFLINGGHARRYRRVASSFTACCPARLSSVVWSVRSHPSR